MRKIRRAKKSVRLSNHVIPAKYEIRLKPDLEAFVFEGAETIYLTLKKATKVITLHSKELDIESVKAKTKSATTAAQKISYDEKAEMATFTFKDQLPKGTLRLHITFHGVLNDKMHGFYRSTYSVGGRERHMATTQFESSDARRAFPSFDEPAMKAVFEVSLVVPENTEAISNTMPTEIAEHEGGYKVVSFAPTPVMSTYLLAFIVGEFEHVQKKSKDGVLVRVFVTPGKKHQAAFALCCATKIVDFFNSYFDIPYPMPALDMIAIPDFSAGAMENWGAITYRETALLVDPQNSSTMNKQWVALVIAHELAHQWFGNLVTMEWWTHLWLNEGFASYIEYLAVDHLFPEWDIWTQFLVSDHGAALHMDGLKNTHPIEVEVHHPAEIASVFDAVSYSKGASIIRMIAEFLGEKNFRDGLRYYLKKHSYKNTATEDLWDALGKVSRKPIRKIMANWTGKAGYPLVTITESARELRLQQMRFFASPISEKRTKDPAVWHVPIVTTNAKRLMQKFLLNTKSTRLQDADNNWLKLNADESGFYRTLYPERLRQLLAEPVQTKELHTRDRFGLIRDMMDLAETGKLATSDGLSFVLNYKGEDEYVVWTEILGGLGKIRSLIKREPFLPEYERYVLDVLSTIGKQIDWNTKPKNHSHALLKVLILESLGRYGDIKIVEHAQKLFTRKVKPYGSGIPADLRGVVYNLAAKYGGPKEHVELIQMYKGAAMHEEKNRIGRALCAFRQRTLLEKTLRFALSPDVRPQDTVRMISGVTINPEGGDLAWSFIKQNWKLFNERYAGTRELSYLLDPLGASTSVQRAKNIQGFIKKHPAPGIERTVQQVLERIHSNAAWLARDHKKIQKYLNSIA